MEAELKHNHCKCKCCSDHHDHCNEEENESSYKTYIGIIVSLSLLVAGLILDHYHNFMTNTTWVRPLWYFVAFIPVGLPVIKEALEGLAKKDYFNEFTLMAIACIGAFCIGEYAEAVGVMLLYCIGENLQDRAVDKASKDISKLLSIRAEKARVIKGEEEVILKPEEVKIGEIIEVRPGEKVPLDGLIVSLNGGLFDTSALTGESIPRDIERGKEVLAGMICSGYSVRIKTTRLATESAVAKILDLVKNAQSKKAKSEIFIRKFARIYTPVVTVFAFLVMVVPYFISLLNPEFHYQFAEWLYRALVFLVISCPCALVISVPLSYFAGIGAASRNGILFKGGNHLDSIRDIDVVAFDKTGTLTTGKFNVFETWVKPGFDRKEMLSLLGAVEAMSNHPLAKAIVAYVEGQGLVIPKISSIQEITGKGTKAEFNGKRIIAGNLKLLNEEKVSYPKELREISSTIVALAVDEEFKGYVELSDGIKGESEKAIKELHSLGVKNIVMLSGDKQEIVDKYAGNLGINQAYGDMLPQDKAHFVEDIAKSQDKKIAFVGDGLNDAPVLTISNVGIAMGGLGSDAAVENADIVIQTDNPSRVATAIRIGRFTREIVIQNVTGALVIKLAVLSFDLIGYANLWWAIFADVGVTILAILNSMRIFWKKYS